MKKILLLSDTHNYLDDQIKSHALEADEIWHAGDIGSLELTDALTVLRPVKAVYGNIDGHKIRSAWPEHQQFICEGLKVMMTHIGGKPGSYPADIIPELQLFQPALFICGHSHILRVIRDPLFNLIYMNPGAAGKTGFHHMRTMLRFQINNSKIEEVAVIELGLRGALP